jgi:hypothetical protein
MVRTPAEIDVPDEPGLLWRAVSIAGLLLLVLAYLVNQAGHTSSDSRRYLIANALGAGLLTAYSAFIREWVFVGLEGFWCLASVWALRRPVRAHDALPGPPAAPAAPPPGGHRGQAQAGAHGQAHERAESRRS